MNRKELVRSVASELRKNDVRKPVSIKKQVFHISDDEGNHKDFEIKRTGKGVIYTAEDVDNIIEACVAVVEDALKKGDFVSIRGFGTIGLRYRKATRTIHPETGEPVAVKAHYVPRFVFGDKLRMCAKLYELSLSEGSNSIPELDDDLIEEDATDFEANLETED